MRDSGPVLLVRDQSWSVIESKFLDMQMPPEGGAREDGNAFKADSVFTKVKDAADTSITKGGAHEYGRFPSEIP
jgi:hypothetical protein